MLLGKAKNYSEQTFPQYTTAWHRARQLKSYHVYPSSRGHGSSTWASLSSRKPRPLSQVRDRDGTKGLNGILTQTHYTRQASDHEPGS